MALPTSDNTVNVTRLGSILSTLWGKIKTALGNKSDKTEGVYYVSGTTPYTAYSSSSTYTKWTSGDYTSSNSCTYGGYAYYCSTAISTAEAWNSAHWTKIPTPTWTGTVTGVTELYAGMKISYKVPIYGGTSSTYLNINNLGNVYVKRNDGNTTSHLPGNTVVILTYDGTYWRWADYDANSTYSGMVTAYVNNAADAAKAATSTNFKLTDGVTILITFNVANTKNAALTLNVNSTGAKTLYINDTVSSASNYTIPAGTYFCHYKVPSGASTGNWYLYTNGTFRAIQFKGGLDGDAATASAAKSGSTLETVINGKQDSLGIDSSTGDTTQFLNKKGQWAVPSGTAQVQSDWNQTTTTAVDYIKNKPQNLVQDASYVHTDNNYTTADKNKVASAVQPGDLATVATSGSYSDLSGKPSTIEWATYGTTTFAQVTAMLTAGNLPCVNYNNKVYKYLSTPYSEQYVFQAEDLSYVTLLANTGESQNVWAGGTAYPSASDIGAATAAQGAKADTAVQPSDLKYLEGTVSSSRDTMTVRKNNSNQTVLSSGDGTTAAPVYIRPKGSTKSDNQFVVHEDGSISLNKFHSRFGYIEQTNEANKKVIRFGFDRTVSDNAHEYGCIRLMYSYNAQPFEVRIAVHTKNYGNDDRCGAKVVVGNAVNTAHIPLVYYRITDSKKYIYVSFARDTIIYRHNVNWEYSGENSDSMSVDLVEAIDSTYGTLVQMGFVPNAGSANVDDGSFSGIGSATRPVYVNGSGQIVACDIFYA